MPENSRGRQWVTIGAAGVALVLAGAMAVVIAATRSREMQTRQHDDTFDGVRQVVVDIDGGDIKVATSAEGERATANARLRWNTRREPAYQARLEGDRLTVRARGCGEFFFRATCEATVLLTVPAGVGLDITADSGDVVADGVRGPVRLDLDSGDAELRSLSGPVSATLDSGSLNATGLASRTFDVEIDSGDLRLEFATAPADVRARADSSDVVILVPAGSGPYAVRTEIDSGRANVQVSTGDGSDQRIAASNDSGDITIAYAR
jgi:hypothetical protein